MKLSQNQLEELERKIRELVPELMELSEGCKVYSQGKIVPLKHEFLRGDGNKTYQINNNGPFTTIEIKELYKIIGHSITLEAVLKAISINKSFLNGFSMAAEVDKVLIWNEWKEISCHWKLMRPWEEQHDIHAFLYQLLITK